MLYSKDRIKKTGSIVAALLLLNCCGGMAMNNALAAVAIPNQNVKIEDSNTNDKIYDKGMGALLSTNTSGKDEENTDRSKIKNVNPNEKLRLVRVSWEPISGAVGYQIVILKNPADKVSDAVFVKNSIFNTGYELDVSNFGDDISSCYWKVCPVNAQSIAIGGYTEPKPLVEQEWNPKAPEATTEFDKMPYSPVYPVFSWIPVNKAHSYDVRIMREDAGIPGKFETIRTFNTDNNIFYEYAGYTWPGKYRWQVRANNAAGTAMTLWSEPCDFVVEKNARVAALGDSITHGGGVSAIPPGYTLYNWETYCKVPVKNIGLSGDTTQGMNARFEQEVLPFKPQILLIMGGVNNFRSGEDAWETIDAMEKIRDKCYYYGIIPVFLTATPINENLIDKVPTIGHPASNWKYEQQVLNCWIKQQKYWVDVTPKMTDSNGRLRAEMTTDGLHPDYEGKKIIGEMVGDYLLEKFPNLNLTEK